MYGNVLNSLEIQIQNQLYCKLISLNTPHFDYAGCLFSKEHMTRVDAGDGLTAEGSGRVSTYLQYGLVHSYTLECNYNMSKYQNEVTIPHHDPKGQQVTPPSPYATSSEKYTPGIYAGVGRACLIALLDLRGHNPCSRIPTSKYKTLERLRYSLVTEVKLRQEYRGQVLSTTRKKAIPSQQGNGNGKSRNQEEQELFHWYRRVEVGDNTTAAPPPATAVAGAANGNEANASSASSSSASAWFISAKPKRRIVDNKKENGADDQQPALPSYRQPTSSSSSSSSSRANDGSPSIFPMISNDSDSAAAANDFAAELRSLKLCGAESDSTPFTSASTSVASSSSSRRDRQEKASNSILIPSLIPKGPKSRPQSFLRNSLKEKATGIPSNGNGNGNGNGILKSVRTVTMTGRDRDRDMERDSRSPVGESTLVMTGRSVTTADSSSYSPYSSSHHFEEKEVSVSVARYEVKSRAGGPRGGGGHKISDDSLSSFQVNESTSTMMSMAMAMSITTTAPPPPAHAATAAAAAAPHSARERSLMSSLYDASSGSSTSTSCRESQREDYIPFTLQQSSPRRPPSSSNRIRHRAISME
jgi:hypothetical protein